MSNGVLLFKGMTTGILNGDFQISINENGELDSKLILSTAYNVIPVWLRIAKDNLALAKLAHEAILEKWSQDPDFQKSLLIAELTPSMQVVVACGIALDGLYEMLRPNAKISEQDINAWKRKRTSRGAQIFEIIRRSYRLSNDASKQIKIAISQIIKLRDMAVHPSLELKNTVLRPEISVGVDWRFSAFSFENAKNCLESTLKIFIHLHEHPRQIKSNSTAMENIFQALYELAVIQPNA